MRKRHVLLAGTVLGLSLTFSCGGIDGIGFGSGSGGSYELGIVLDQGTTIISRTPTVRILSQEYGTIEVNENPDEISGYIYYRYKGKNYDNAMRLYIQEAKICIEGVGCYNLGVGSSMPPSDDTRTTFGKLFLSQHKFTQPWLVVNPWEDTVINQRTITYSVSTPSGNTLNLSLPDEKLGYRTLKYGRVMSVYEAVVNSQGQETKGSLLCNNIGNDDSCTISRNSDGVFTITFKEGSKPARVFIEYTVELYIDMNKDITITDADRKTTNTVNGYAYVKGKLDSGDTLEARLPIQFVIVR